LKLFFISENRFRIIPQDDVFYLRVFLGIFLGQSIFADPNIILLFFLNLYFSFFLSFPFFSFLFPPTPAPT